MSEELKRIFDYLIRKKGRTLGVFLGLILGWGVMKYGLWKVLFLAIFAGAGYLIGRFIDERRRLDDVLDRFFSYRGRNRR